MEVEMTATTKVLRIRLKRIEKEITELVANQTNNDVKQTLRRIASNVQDGIYDLSEIEAKQK